MQKGLLVVVSGFSGSGKSTVTKRLAETYERYALSISATTRAPREGEREGVEYFFKTPEEFEALVQAEELLEYAYYVENGYGTPASFVEEQRNAGRDVLLEIEIQGAMKVRERCPDAILIYIITPTVEELVRRLTSRGTESEDRIRSRLQRACEEAKGMDAYDYLVVNDDVQTCVEEIHHLLDVERMRTVRQADRIATIQKELKEWEEQHT